MFKFFLCSPFRGKQRTIIRIALGTFVVVFFASTFPACKQNNSSDTKFAILSYKKGEEVKNQSLLAMMDRSQGSIDLAIVFYDNGKLINPGEQKINAEVALMRRAINEWIAPLKDQKGWKYSEVKINLRTVTSETKSIEEIPCKPSGEMGYPYVCRPSTKEVHLVRATEPLRAYASLGEYFLVLGRDNNYSVYRHEVGHLMGMADTYEEWLFQKLNEEPDKSIMNGGGVNYNALTEDDILGIKQIWSFIKTGKMICPTGYREGGVVVEQSRVQNFMCVRSSTASRKSCSYLAKRDPVKFEWGTEPDGSSCYIGPSPVRNYPSCSITTAVDSRGWGFENGASCWRIAYPKCSEQAKLLIYYPKIGFMGGVDNGKACIALSCSASVVANAAGWGTENGKSCKSPQADIPVDNTTPEEMQLDGYPICSRYAIAHVEDSTWGIEVNGVSCHMMPLERSQPASL